MEIAVTVGLVLGCIGAVVLYVICVFVLLVILPRWPGVITEPFKRDIIARVPDVDSEFYTRTTLKFPSASAGISQGAWLYLPKLPRDCSPPPLVIMGCGLTGQIDFKLHNFAAAFSEAGIACLAFDYRYQGSSDGEPRHWASPHNYAQDYAAALRFAMTGIDGRVDPTRVAVFGTAVGGGPAITNTARMGKYVKAVVVQVPAISGPASTIAQLKMGRLMAGVVIAYAQDWCKRLVGLRPGYIQYCGDRSDGLHLMMMKPEQKKLLLDLSPERSLGGWQNRLLLRSAMEFSWYNPARFVGSMDTPILLCPGRIRHRLPLPCGGEAWHGKYHHVELCPLESDHMEPYFPRSCARACHQAPDRIPGEALEPHTACTICLIHVFNLWQLPHFCLEAVTESGGAVANSK
eukprot:jgi/Botrbrau1/7892/Bobra.9_2s0065.1